MDMKDENKEKVDIELITAYAQMAFFTQGEQRPAG